MADLTFFDLPPPASQRRLPRPRARKLCSFSSVEGVESEVCQRCGLETPDDHMIVTDCPKIPAALSRTYPRMCVGCAYDEGIVCLDEFCDCQSVV